MRVVLVIPEAALLIEHSGVFERVREYGHTARSARVTTKVLYASLPVSELSRLPPPRDNPLCHRRRRRHRGAPAHPFQLPFHFGNLIHGLSAILPHPSRSMLVKRWARVALAPSAYAVASHPPHISFSLSLSLLPTFSRLSFCFSRRIALRFSPSLSIGAVAPIRAHGWR